MWENNEMMSNNDFIGNLADVKEVVRLIPPTQNVLCEILDSKIFNTKKDGTPATWKQIRITFNIVNGIQIGEEIKFRNSRIQQSFVYFADPEIYDFTNPFFKNGSYLVPLKQLVLASGINAVAMIKGGLSDDTIAQLAEHLKGMKVLANIIQKPIQIKNEDGKYVNTEDLQNELRGFKKVPDEILV